MAATETVRELHLLNLTSKVYLGGRQECQEELFEPAGQSHFKTIVHSSQQETLPISEVRQFAQQSDRAGTVGTRWDLVVQALVSGRFCNEVLSTLNSTAIVWQDECGQLIVHLFGKLAQTTARC